MAGYRISTIRTNVTRSFRILPGRTAIVVRQIGGHNGDPFKDDWFPPKFAFRKASRCDTRAKYAVRGFSRRS